MKQPIPFIAPMLAALSCVISAPAFPRALPMPLRTKVARADVIAVVRIETTAPNPRKAHYRSVATARVLRAIKGSAPDGRLTLDFDNGLACPNVTYDRGEECLVFLCRQRNRHYDTYNTYYGKYLVQNGSVEDWQVKPYTSRTIPIAAVIHQIRATMRRN